MRQGQGEDLIWSQASIATPSSLVRFTFGTIDDVIKIAAGCKPKLTFKACRDSCGQRRISACIVGTVEFFRQIAHDRDCVEPECIDFHRFTDARSDHPVADLGVHPSQLHSSLPCPQSRIGLIDADAETSAAY